MEIFDAHHHLWDLAACRYPWLEAKGERRFFGDPTPIQKNFLVSDLREHAAGFELTGSTHIQVGVADGDELKESAWLQSRSETEGLPSVAVAFCDLRSADTDHLLAAQSDIPIVRGIRHIVGREAEEDRQQHPQQLLEDPVWVKNLGKLPAHDLSFDLQLIPEQHEQAAEVLADLPNLRVAVCHAGSPWDRTANGLALWKRGLTALANNPNVHCKLSGLAMFTRNANPEDWRPIVQGVIDTFGPERVMCGSNFPVDSLYVSYDAVWRTFELLVQGLSTEQQRGLLSRNARTFYRTQL